MKFPLIRINKTLNQLIGSIEILLLPMFDFFLTLTYVTIPVVSTRFLVCWKTANYADSYWFLYSMKCGFSEQHFIPVKKEK